MTVRLNTTHGHYGVPVNDRGKHLNHFAVRHCGHRGDAETERANVGENNVLKRRVARDQARLYRCPVHDRQVRIGIRARKPAKQFRYHAAKRKHAGGAADEHNVVNIVRAQIRISHCALHWSTQPQQQLRRRVGERLLVQRPPVLFPVCREQNLNRIACRQLALGRFYLDVQLLSFVEILQYSFELVLFFDCANYRVVKVLATESAVARRGVNFEDPIEVLENADIKGTTTKVEHHESVLVFIVQSVGHRRGCRLIDESVYLEAG